MFKSLHTTGDTEPQHKTSEDAKLSILILLAFLRTAGMLEGQHIPALQVQRIFNK